MTDIGRDNTAQDFTVAPVIVVIHDQLYRLSEFQWVQERIKRMFSEDPSYVETVLSNMLSTEKKLTDVISSLTRQPLNNNNIEIDCRNLFEVVTQYLAYKLDFGFPHDILKDYVSKAVGKSKINTNHEKNVILLQTFCSLYEPDCYSYTLYLELGILSLILRRGTEGFSEALRAFPDKWGFLSTRSIDPGKLESSEGIKNVVDKCLLEVGNDSNMVRRKIEWICTNKNIAIKKRNQARNLVLSAYCDTNILPFVEQLILATARICEHNEKGHIYRMKSLQLFRKCIDKKGLNRYETGIEELCGF